MELLESELDKLALNIKELEKRRQVLGKSIVGIKKDLLFTTEDKDILEDKFIFKVKPHSLDDLKAAAVDGGIVDRKYHGVNLVVGRAVSVVFEYKKGNLLEPTYFPDPFPKPEPLAYTDPISHREFAINSALARVKLEISTANQAVSRFKPEIMLLDGSIVLHGMDKPNKGSSYYESYKEVVSLYESLYETCKKSNTLLGGVVEDSSGLRLSSLLYEKVVPGIIKSGEFKREVTDALTQNKSVLKVTNDSNLMYHILDVGERSCSFSYSKDPGKHQILRDLGKWGSAISSFYLKTVEFDRPIRIDFLNGVERKENTTLANKIASIVLAMSVHNETYGIPSMIIEADARAKLSEKDLDLVYQRLKDKVGDSPSLFKLRRELRPF